MLSTLQWLATLQWLSTPGRLRTACATFFTSVMLPKVYR